MLAVKLHKTPRPWLGEGSHLIPIVSWECGKLQVRNWIGLLTVSQRARYPNTAIRYITLVRVPADHPVELSADWVASWPKLYAPLRDEPHVVKDELARWTAAQRSPNYPAESPRLRCPTPQLVLGAPLPKWCIKWTKDARLLYRGDRRLARRKAAAE